MLNLLIFLLVHCSLQFIVEADGTYECGEHGRFEYCIDEIPGCVIGCHCHPGYYFDTDTKICEPNSKLLEHHRRHYVGEPTRVQGDFTPVETFDLETTTVKNINSHVNDIAKDADDLGDWLYNQFFKTIESQVVNNTNKKEALTRRSGTSGMKKPKRMNKWRKGKKNHKKRRRNKVKKNLLRIDENDSLFDISKSSSSDSSESSSESLSSDEFEEKIDNHDNDEEHGHKQIVMINKKPKPPLPSFIFLPNIDTPFYPPLGLPPPPIVPMYPMIPVPPVIPLPIPDNCETTSTSTTKKEETAIPTETTTTTTEPTIESTTTEDATPEPTEAETTNTEASNTETTKDALRLQRQRKKKEPGRNRNQKLQLGFNKMNSNGRHKILQRLHEQMKKSPKHLRNEGNKKAMQTPFMNENKPEAPILDNTIPVDVNNNDIQYNPWQEDRSLPENVDFKYISELIHRVDLKNKTNDLLPPIEYNPLDSIEMYNPKDNKNYYQYYDAPMNSFDKRRSNRNNEKQIDDSYYTNLGRQIATMIRGIDSQNKQVNIEMERTNDKIKNNPYFNQNSRQSFWERSVRSPLRFLNSNRNKFEYLKKSNEILFNIENKVEIMASTVPALSLREIENIVKAMEAAKLDIQRKEINVRDIVPSNRNLDIKLWPQELKVSGNIKVPDIMKKGDDIDGEKFIAKKNQGDDKKLRMQNVQKFLALNNPNAIKNNQHARQFPEKSIKNPLIGNSYFVNDPLNYNQIHYGVIDQRRAKSIPLAQKDLTQPLLEHAMNPLFLKHRKYFQDKNDNNVFNHNRDLSQFSNSSLLEKPSYFRQEINHFDYF